MSVCGFVHRCVGMSHELGGANRGENPHAHRILHGTNR